MFFLVLVSVLLHWGGFSPIALVPTDRSLQELGQSARHVEVFGIDLADLYDSRFLQQEQVDAPQRGNGARLLRQRRGSPGNDWHDVGPADGMRALVCLEPWLFAMTEDGSLFRQHEKRPYLTWQFVARMSQVRTMTAYRDRIIIANASGDILWRRIEASDDRWHLIVRQSDVVAMTAGADALWTSQRNGDFNRIDLATGRVQRIGTAGNIREMGFQNGRLYALRSDGRIWERPAVAQNAKWNLLGQTDGAIAICVSTNEMYVVAEAPSVGRQ